VRLFAKIDGVSNNRFDRAMWLTPPFDLFYGPAQSVSVSGDAATDIRISSTITDGIRLSSTIGSEMRIDSTVAKGG